MNLKIIIKRILSRFSRPDYVTIKGLVVSLNKLLLIPKNTNVSYIVVESWRDLFIVVIIDFL